MRESEEVSDQEDQEDQVSGQYAIDKALNELHTKQEGRFYRPQLPYLFGGNEPLDSIAIYESEEEIPHWHYVTYGFSELWGKESDDPEISGYGFELTFRLKKSKEKEPPVWPLNFLQNLARYVFQTGNVFGDGHHMNANGPIALEEDTQLTAVGFITDPQLGKLHTPNGTVEFLEVVGITQDELDALVCWNCKGLLELLKEQYPLYVTDLSRSSIMEKEEYRRRWEEGVEKEGSSTRFFYTDEFHFEPLSQGWKLIFGVGHALLLCRMLRARVEKGRELLFAGAEQSVLFRPGEEEILTDDNTIIVSLQERNISELCGLLKQEAGSYACKTIPLVIELVPTVIRDQYGNVTETIG